MILLFLFLCSALGPISPRLYDNIVNTVNELDSATGFSSDMGSIIDGMVNASSSVRYNIKGGAEGLAKAAHTANRLGLSMDEIAAAAESHLDFESSIAKEIEAEMYLQKDLNLDKLRYAALTGDTATAAAEEERLIKENMKSLKGNVLAQQAFAAATGISRDRLNDVMSNQERISKLTPQQLKDENRRLESKIELHQQEINTIKNTLNLKANHTELKLEIDSLKVYYQQDHGQQVEI